MRVVIAEDSVLLREGLIRLLTEQGTTVTAAVGDGEQLLRATQAHQPDVCSSTYGCHRPSLMRGCGRRW